MIEKETGLAKLLLRVRSLYGATLAGFGWTNRSRVIRLRPASTNEPERRSPGPR